MLKRQGRIGFFFFPARLLARQKLDIKSVPPVFVNMECCYIPARITLRRPRPGDLAAVFACLSRAKPLSSGIRGSRPPSVPSVGPVDPAMGTVAPLKGPKRVGGRCP